MRVSRRIEPLHEPSRTLRPKFISNSIAAGYSGTCPWHQQLDRRRDARCSIADRGKFFRSLWLTRCLSSANWTVLSLLDLCTSVNACCQTMKFYRALPVSDFFQTDSLTRKKVFQVVKRQLTFFVFWNVSMVP